MSNWKWLNTFKCNLINRIKLIKCIGEFGLIFFQLELSNWKNSDVLECFDLFLLGY